MEGSGQGRVYCLSRHHLVLVQGRSLFRRTKRACCWGQALRLCMAIFLRWMRRDPVAQLAVPQSHSHHAV